MGIKEYWETRLPQIWYSDKKPSSNEWFNEIEYKRYKVYYPYLKDVAEFDAHRGERVLELGFGIGTDTLQYLKGGADVYGTELARNAYRYTRHNLKRSGFKLKNPPERYKFDLAKLTTNLEYSIEAGAIVLKGFMNRYQHKEIDWFTRYNARSRTKRDIYMNLIERYF